MAAKYWAGVYLVAALAMPAMGCSLELGDSPFLCNKGGKPECPVGYTCTNNYCVKEGECPDTVPGCKGTSTCGNGTCEAGEKTTCPKDCTGGNNEAGPPDDGGPKDIGNTPPDTVPWAADQPIIMPDTDPWPPDNGPTQAGYGFKCNSTTLPCQPGLDCIAVGSACTSFCTKKCTTSGQVCTGNPAGTSAYCLLENSSTGQYHCAFICKLDTQTWACPGNLTCSPTPNPPTSKQYPCLP